MKLNDFRLSTRIAGGMLLLVMFSALLWIGVENVRMRTEFLGERSINLEAALHLEKVQLTQSIETLRQDVLFLANTPPISGMLRARANNGVDPRDNNPYATWEGRLQEIFSAFLRAHPEYFQVRYIGVSNNGRELVRVERLGNKVEVAPHEFLQAKGDRDYFVAGLGLSVGRVFLSDIALNQEWGKVEEPQRPTLRAVTPVFDANGQVFGMVVVNMSAAALLASAAEGLPSGVRAYIADQQGHYLLHPDVKRAFEHEFGSQSRITDDFPSLLPLFNTRSHNYLPLHEGDGPGEGHFVTAERVYFDNSAPSRFLMLAYELPAGVMAAQIARITWPRIVETLLAMLLIGGVLLFMLRRTFLPLQRITADAREIAAGNLHLRLTSAGGGEIGDLTEALNAMLDKLSVYELTDRENIFLNALIETLPGFFCMTDAQGKLQMWNHNFELVSQLSSQELSFSYVQDFFSGDDKLNIENVIRRVFEQGEAEMEATLLPRDGMGIPFRFTARRAERDGVPVMLGLGLDLTQQRESMRAMQRHQQIIATALDGFWMTDEQGMLEEVNKAYADISGYSMDELVGMHIGQLDASDRSDNVKERIEKIMAGGYERFETQHRRKDGSLVDIEVSAAFMRESKKFFVFCRDITQRKLHSMELQRSHYLLNEAERLGKFGSWELNLVRNELRWSDEVYRIFEFDPEQVVPSYQRFLQTIHPDDRAKVDDAYARSLQDRQAYFIEHRLLFADGRIKWVREHCTTAFDQTGKPLRSVGMVQDITEHKLAEEEVRVASAAFETHDAIVITDAMSSIIRVNRAFSVITGFAAEEVIGKNPRIMKSGRHDHAFYADMWQQIVDKGSWAGEIWDRRKNGEIYPKWMTVTAVKNELGETTQYVAIFSDITQRKLAEEEIRNLAFYDALTQLPNRRLFQERFRTALLASERHGDYGAILFIDMDRFKTLNDTLGHDYGDMLLVEVAKRIKSCVREIDTVARLGGDEFVVLLDNLSNEREDASHKVGMVAEKIREVLSHSYQLSEHEHFSSPSIGISLFHGSDESMDVLLKHADAAMYQAKNAGRNAVRFYDPELQQDLESRAVLENDLRRAIDNRELQLYYQVQVDREYRPIGFEALIRWPHPQRGMVPPARFIPVAEESSLILEIGNWVLETACMQLAHWKDDARMAAMTLAINVSAHQFRVPGFVEQIDATLKRHRLDPSCLKLELTESVVLGDLGEVVTKMQALKGLGVQLSLDDFGTGYSSLSYLRRLPLDQIKIDQSFVHDIADDLESAMMVLSIIDMARNFHLDVIAEGVETEAQLAFLGEQDCQAFQGYFFGKPVALEELAAVMDRLL